MSTLQLQKGAVLRDADNFCFGSVALSGLLLRFSPASRFSSSSSALGMAPQQCGPHEAQQRQSFSDLGPGL